MPSKLWIVSRIGIAFFAMAIGFLISNGFQVNRIFGLTFFSLALAIINNIVWYAIFFMTKTAFIFFKSISAERKVLAIAIIAEIFVFHLYVCISFLVYFAPLISDSEGNSNFSAAGAGGRVLIESGELTMFGMSNSLLLLSSAFVAAAVIKLLGITYVLFRKSVEE